MNIGDRIKKRRKEIGMSAEQLAKRVGKSPATIYRYENGDIRNVDSRALIPIADALGVSPGVLMGWNDPPEHIVIDQSAASHLSFETPRSIQRSVVHSVARARLPQRRLTVTEGSRPGVKIVRADAVPVTAGLKTDLTTEERSLLEAFRAADDRAKDDAYKMLLDHPKYN